MKPTKEQIIEWVRAVADSGKVDPVSTGGLFVTLTPEELQCFTNIVYAKGQEDMRERCASLAETTPKVWDCEAPPPQQRIATAIRALPIQKGGED